jgi:GNAT superfamily N-acetyltransferase
MSIAIRDRRDPVAEQAPLPGLTVGREADVILIAAVQDRPRDVIERRFEAGHRAYVARIGAEPAAFGWVATRSAEIGEMAMIFDIPTGDRYLWNFVTLPSHRGKGVYPRLLDAIVRIESAEADRFWIAYAPENHASASGIIKAGFVAIAELLFDAGGKPALKALLPGGGSIASRMFGVAESGEELRQCWRCARAGRPGMKCEAGSCECDYQKPHSGCAA